VKRLALLALLLSSSCVVAAPAPMAKPQRKAERPARQESDLALYLSSDVILVGGFNVNVPPLGAIQPAPQAPAQPPNADPPG
jgi:hypothetical protein